MDFSTTMNKADMAVTKAQVDSLNKSLGLNTDKKGNSILGKDDFLKILMTQLTHQDPTKPLSDTAFISQMAQFSSLEQMTNIGEGFKKMNEILASNQALNILGKKVQITSGSHNVEGVVKAISSGPSPQVLVDGTYYDYSNVQKVME